MKVYPLYLQLLGVYLNKLQSLTTGLIIACNNNDKWWIYIVKDR